MTLRLNGSTSGYTEIDAPAVAGSNTLVLPGGNGSADQALVTNGSGTLSFADRGRMVLDTAKASTSGTFVDFTGIPSWVKRVTVMFAGVSTNGSSHIQVQIGSGSITTTGYSSYGGVAGSTNIASGVSSTTGFIAYAGAGTNILSGSCVVTLLSGTIYTASVAGGINSAGSPFYALACGGFSPALSGTLDRIRITTVNGTDTFDAGSINILLEG